MTEIMHNPTSTCNNSKSQTTSFRNRSITKNSQTSKKATTTKKRIVRRRVMKRSRKKKMRKNRMRMLNCLNNEVIAYISLIKLTLSNIHKK